MIGTRLTQIVSSSIIQLQFLSIAMQCYARVFIDSTRHPTSILKKRKGRKKKRGMERYQTTISRRDRQIGNTRQDKQTDLRNQKNLLYMGDGWTGNEQVFPSITGGKSPPGHCTASEQATHAHSSRQYQV